MSITRRKFVRSGTAIILSTVVPLSAEKAFGQKSQPSSQAGATKSSDLSSMTMATFQKYLNTYFEFSLNGRWVADLELIEVADTRPPEVTKASPVSKECFALVFTGQWPIQQATYTLQHNRLGSFQLLVVPMGSGRYGFEADAIINRLVP